jgi:hypothetical protein
MKAIEKLSKSSDNIMAAQLDLPKDFIEQGHKLDKLTSDINRTIARTYNSFVGLGQDHNAQEVNQLLALSKKNAEGGKKGAAGFKQQVESFKKSIAGNDAATMLVQQRKTYKASLYSSYDLILGIIPKMKLAVNTIANSVISPDDFTKHSLTIAFNESNLPEETVKEAKDQLKEIVKKYKLEEDLKADVIDALVKGEKYYAVLSLNDELKGLLKEQATSAKNSGYRTLEGLTKKFVNESTAIQPEEFHLLSEGLEIFNEGVDKDKQISRDTFLNDLDAFLTENMVIGDSSHFLEEHLDSEKELTEAVAFKNPLQQQVTGGKNRESVDSSIDGLKLSSDSAICRKLNADSMVKLEFDNRVFGYIYVDTMSCDGNKATKAPGTAGVDTSSNTITSAVQNVLYSSNDIQAGFGAMPGRNPQAMNDPKMMFLADVFANRLSQKENIKLIRKSEQLKYVIYHSLITRRITKDEKLRVLFFTPDEVVHIDRKESIFDNVLFFAKMYIATLITILMQNIVRGADKRAYYIDIGLENDAANAVNEVIRSIKAKDISNIHNMDLSSVMNMLGEFNDYYIPTIDGEKPISMETVEGLSNISLDNEFLNWLSNNIFSGLGLPAAYLTEVENVDFAKTLAMQNSRFIRDIIAEQVIFGKGYSELLRKLYMKEHGYNRNRSKAQDEAADKEKIIDTRLLDIESIEIKFPSPVSLNMTNLNDQLNNLNVLVETLGEIVDVPTGDKEAAAPIFKREMYKKFLSNLNWEDIDAITQKVKEEVIRMKLKNPVTPDNIASGTDAAVPPDDGGDEAPAPEGAEEAPPME